MKTYSYGVAFETTIEVPFKALCPISDSPCYYHAILKLHYTSKKVFDYNDVALAVHKYCEEGARSVENMVIFGTNLIRNNLGKDTLDLCVVEVPEQVGHLHVVVSSD